MHYRWRNRFIGIAVAVLSLLIAQTFWPDITRLEGLAILLTGFVIGWVFDAWIGRTVYWYRRGTRGAWTFDCQHCNRRRYLLSGDLIAKCHRCGYKPGVIGLRWLRYSVPAQQLRRTVGRANVLSAIVLTIIVVFIASLGVGLPPLQAATPTMSDTDQTDTPSAERLDASATPSASPTTTDTQTEFSESVVARLVLRKVNEIRQENGLNRLSNNSQIVRAADAHAEDMARYDYLDHTSLDGETVRERYPFCPAGENIAQSWVFEGVLINGETRYYSNGKELAEGLVVQWMNSREHRENILLDRYVSSGVGISISPDGKVYAVQGFCAKN